MTLVVNGKSVNIANSLAVSELLKKMNIKMPDMVSVELNGEIIRRDRYDEVMLNEGDEVEFLYFMGGGYGIQRRTD